MSSVPELGTGEKLLHIVERWLRAEREGRPARTAAKADADARKAAEGQQPASS